MAFDTNYHQPEIQARRHPARAPRRRRQGHRPRPIRRRFRRPGQLVGLVLRSPHAHAKIKKIDTSKAEKLPGVKAIITSADLPDLTNGDRGMYDMLENCMAREKALYDGHAVAAVAAIDANTARKALKLIKVDYEILPHVTDVDEAVKPSAPVMHDACFTEGVEPKPTKPSNIAKRSRVRPRRRRAGFKDADVIVERTYKTEQTHQGYIEPHACLANVGPDGQGELWVCTQGHFVYRNQCAAPARHGYFEAARHRVRNRRRLRRQDPYLDRALGAGAVAQGQPSGQARHDPRGSVPRFGSDKLHLDRRQDRRQARTARITAAQATLRYQGGAFPASGPSSAP